LLKRAAKRTARRAEGVAVAMHGRSRPRPRPRPLSAALPLLALSLLAPVALAGDSYTLHGCLCYGACERTIDSPFVPWCATTASVDEGAAGNVTAACAFATYSPSRHAYWEACVQNVTGVAAAATAPLTTFEAMWTTMTGAAVAGTALAYALMGCAASLLTSPRRTLWWLPEAAALFGAAQGLVVGGAFSAVLAFLYLSFPTAIDRSVALALGVAMALLLAYGALGRTFSKPPPAHGSD